MRTCSGAADTSESEQTDERNVTRGGSLPRNLSTRWRTVCVNSRYHSNGIIPVATRYHRFPLRNDILVRFYPHRVMSNNAAMCASLSRASADLSRFSSSRISRNPALFLFDVSEICYLSKIWHTLNISVYIGTLFGESAWFLSFSIY